MALKGQFVTTDEIPEDEQSASPTTKSRERDEFQVARDADVAALKAAWEAAGQPNIAILSTDTGFQRAAKKRYVIEKGDVAEVKTAIRRACLLHKVTPVYAPVATSKTSRTLQDGQAAIVYTVGPLLAKEAGNGAASTEAPENAKNAESSQDAETPEDGNRRRGFRR